MHLPLQSRVFAVFCSLSGRKHAHKALLLRFLILLDDLLQMHLQRLDLKLLLLELGTKGRDFLALPRLSFFSHVLLHVRFLRICFCKQSCDALTATLAGVRQLTALMLVVCAFAECLLCSAVALACLARERGI